MDKAWLNPLKQLVEKKPIIVLNFDDGEWEQLRQSRRGINQFTVARSHTLLADLKVPAPCLVQGKNGHREDLYFGQISLRRPTTTLQSLIKVQRLEEIQPRNKAGLFRLVTDKRHLRNLRERLCDRLVVSLSPRLSSHLIERLASIDANLDAMRGVAEALLAPKNFQGVAALQDDAVRTALKAFGLNPNDHALSLDLVKGRETALARIGIMEDSVIEHDAR